jgi:V8-like Glu-specific endopeptidase
MVASEVKYLLTFFLLLNITPAIAQVAFDPLKQMEASTGCPDASCGNPSASRLLASVQHFQDLVQKANLFDPQGRDPRKLIPRNGRYAPIGRMYSKRENKTEIMKSTATSFLVSPCHVLTNHHVAFPRNPEEDRTRRVIDPGKTSSWFIYGTNRDDVVKASPVAWGAFDTTKDPGDDWVLMGLSECVGATKGIGWLEIVGETPPGMKKAAIAGFHTDLEANQLFGQSDCKVEQKARTYWTHYCATTNGASGAPLFYVDKDHGTLKVFALNTGSLLEKKKPDGSYEILREEEGKFANLALNLGAIMPELSQHISPAVAEFGSLNPINTKVVPR